VESIDRQTKQKPQRKKRHMINFKKGPALSLHQVNYVGPIDTTDTTPSTGIVSGMVVRINSDGSVAAGATSSTADINTLYGFAINNATAGDVIEAGKIGVFALDGMSVVETDQTATEITSTTYPIGKALSVDINGKVKAVDTSSYQGKIIGWVEGIRSIPAQANGATVINGRSFTYPVSTTVLGIKLAS
jgi:predicted RecA/RadA family phage recombinase